MENFNPGIHPDVPFRAYLKRQLDVANNSGLKLIDSRTPAHYKQWVEDGNKPKTMEEQLKEDRHFRVGRIVHSAILEPDTFNDDYVLMPDFGAMQSSTNRKIRDEWLASLPPGTSIVKQDEKDLAMAMREAVLKHKTARLIIEGGKPEVTMNWIDDRTGLKCKARADWWNEELGFAMDLKTTQDASPGEFGRSVASFGYNRQHCHYADGFRILQRPIRNYLILAVEKEAPHCVAVYHIDAAAEERGFQLLHRSMDKLARCVETNQWPAYSQDISIITMPGWAFSDKG